MTWDEEMLAELERPRNWSATRIRAETAWIQLTQPYYEVRTLRRRRIIEAETAERSVA